MTYDEYISLFSSAKLPVQSINEYMARCLNNSNILSQITPISDRQSIVIYEDVAMYINDNVESQSFNKFLSTLNTETIKALLWKLNIELNQRNNT